MAYYELPEGALGAAMVPGVSLDRVQVQKASGRQSAGAAANTKKKAAKKKAAPTPGVMATATPVNMGVMAIGKPLTYAPAQGQPAKLNLARANLPAQSPSVVQQPSVQARVGGRQQKKKAAGQKKPVAIGSRDTKSVVKSLSTGGAVAFAAQCKAAGGTSGTNAQGRPTCTVAGNTLVLQADGTTKVAKTAAESRDTVKTVALWGGVVAGGLLLGRLLF